MQIDYIKIIKILSFQTYNNIRAYNLVKDPQPGDLVVELSTALTDRESNFGRLILCREEFVPFNEEPGGYYDKFWYIETPEGTLARWHNCNFVKVMESMSNATQTNTRWVVEAIKRHELDK